MNKRVLGLVFLLSGFLSSSVQINDVSKLKSKTAIKEEDRIEILDSNNDKYSDGIVLVRGSDISGEVDIDGDNFSDVKFYGERTKGGYNLIVPGYGFELFLNFDLGGSLIFAKQRYLNNQLNIIYDIQDRAILFSQIGKNTVYDTHKVVLENGNIESILTEIKSNDKEVEERVYESLFEGYRYCIRFSNVLSPVLNKYL